MFGGGFGEYDGFTGMHGMQGPTGTFKAQYRCYSVSMFTDRKEIEQGGKVIMPPSALDQLTRLNTQYPMLFKMYNPSAHTTSHCGVLEFIADEGKIFIPYWMMQNLCMQEGEIIHIESASLQLGTYAQFQPQSRDFLDIYNPKAVLEASLRKLSCLSLGDMLEIYYNTKTYQFRVLTLKPADAVSIIECDLSVDFAPYVGAEEDERQRKAQLPNRDDVQQEKLRVAEQQRIDQALREAEEQNGAFKVFSGKGNVLDTGGKVVKRTKKKGKQTAAAASSRQQGGVNALDGAASNAGSGSAGASAADDSSQLAPTRVRGVPNYNHDRATLTFARIFPKKQEETGDVAEEFLAFGGSGHSMRSKRRR